MGTEELHLRREGLIARLASAFQRRDLAAFEPDMRPDMVLTLSGASRLAGTYRGYGAFARYLEALRQVVRSAEQRIIYEHEGDDMTFHQTMVVAGPRHQVEITLKVLVRFADDGRVASFHVQPLDQGLFDHVIDSTTDEPFEP
jgi:ketosteroid isomerase-like protein